MKITINELEQFALNILASHQFEPAHRQAIVDNLMAAQIDECHSHGVWRLIEIINNVIYERINIAAKPSITNQTGAIIRIDADMGAAPYALQYAFPKIGETAKELGIALVAINHCIHFSALWVEIEKFTEQNLVALNMTTSHAWVAPYGGTQPLFGTNPFAFGWPRINQPYPYVFDFATSETARGEIQLHKRNGGEIPEGWAIDTAGNPTTDPIKALAGAMLPFGGYKGSAISMMIELLAGPLIGDLTSQESMDFADGSPTMPYGGELIIVIDPKTILGDQYETHFQRAENFFQQYLDSGARLPSMSRFEARERTKANQYITIDPSLYDDLKALKKQ